MKKLFCVLLVFACGAAGVRAQRHAPPAGGCPAPVELRIPNPVLVLTGLDTSAKSSDGKFYVGVSLFVSNYAKFPDFLFAPAPELAPCGENKSAPRAWLRAFDAKTGKELYLHCALTNPTALRTASFNVARAELPAEIYAALGDRAAKKTYKSNCVRIADGKPCEEVPFEVATAPPPAAIAAGVP